MERENHKENPNSITETSHQIHSPVVPHNYYYMLHATCHMLHTAAVLASITAMQVDVLPLSYW